LVDVFAKFNSRIKTAQFIKKLITEEILG